jgi:hypothetical protein
MKIFYILLLNFSFNLLASSSLRDNKHLNKLIICSANLIESQFSGHESVFYGLDFLVQIIKTKNSNCADYRALKQECKALLGSYKKRQDLKQIRKQPIEFEEKDVYRKSLKSRYSLYPHLIALARKSENSSWVCHKSIGLDANVGLFLSVSSGWNNYKCTSTLGRRIHIIGPSLGVGIGVGANVDINASDSIKFNIPLYSPRKISPIDYLQCSAFGLGSAETSNSCSFNPPKSQDISVGIGSHNIKRRSVHVVVKRKPKFKESGMYDSLGI